MNPNEVAEYNQELMETAAFYINAKLEQNFDTELNSNWNALLSINLFRKQPDKAKAFLEYPELLEQKDVVDDLWDYFSTLTQAELALIAFETIQEML